MGSCEYPFVLLERYIKIIEKNINKYIRYFMDYDIQISLDKKENSLYIEQTNTFMLPLSLECASTYQQIIIYSLIKLFIISQNSNNSTNLLIIDEIIGSIHPDRYNCVKLLLELMVKYYKKIMIISHNKELLNILNDINIKQYKIEINKISNVSNFTILEE